MNCSEWRAEFPILERSTYLISNSLGAIPHAVYDEMRAYADSWALRGIRPGKNTARPGPRPELMDDSLPISSATSDADAGVGSSSRAPRHGRDATAAPQHPGETAAFCGHAARAAPRALRLEGAAAGMNPTAPELSIVIPAYNEEARLPGNARRMPPIFGPAPRHRMLVV